MKISVTDLKRQVLNFSQEHCHGLVQGNTKWSDRCSLLNPSLPHRREREEKEERFTGWKIKTALLLIIRRKIVPNIQNQYWAYSMIMELNVPGAGITPAVAGQVPRSPGLDSGTGFRNVQTGIRKSDCRILFRRQSWIKKVRPSWSLIFKQSMIYMAWNTSLVKLGHLFYLPLPAGTTLLRTLPCVT